MGYAIMGLSNDEKRREALAWLGERWLLHPANRVKRLDHENEPRQDPAEPVTED